MTDISEYEFILSCMTIDELYTEHRRRIRSIAALEIDIDDKQTKVNELNMEIDNMISEKNSELSQVKAIDRELVKREKGCD